MLITIVLYLYAFSFSMIVSLLLTRMCRTYALKKNILAFPHKERLHDAPVPLLGGVAIACAFYLSILIHYILVVVLPSPETYLPTALVPYHYGIVKRIPQFSIILICGFLIFFLGLLDDLKTLGPKRKIFFEVFIGVVLYYNNVRITLFFGEGLISLCMTVFWVVAITNAFNLLDNIDGLAAGIAVIGAFILLLLCIQGGQILVALLLTIFIGSVLGFLRYNYPPASIFMGDAGSLFIGYIMSVLTILSTFYFDDFPSIIPFVSPLLILAVPIYDTVSVVLIRIKNKKSIFTGDKNHFSHRLLRLGMSQKETILFIYLVAICLGIAALTLNIADARSQLILLVQSVGLLSIIHLLERARNNR